MLPHLQIYPKYAILHRKTEELIDLQKNLMNGGKVRISGYQHGPVARIFRLGLHGCLSIEDYRGSGGMLPQEIFRN